MNHLYSVFKEVIGRWLSLVEAPGLGSNDVFPWQNQAGNSMSLFAISRNDLTTPSCSELALFHQKLINLSGPEALQFFFLAKILAASEVSRAQASSDGGGTRL